MGRTVIMNVDKDFKALVQQWQIELSKQGTKPSQREITAMFATINRPIIKVEFTKKKQFKLIE